MARVSVIVPAYRDLAVLRRTIPLLAALEPRREIEIVVVNNDPAQDVRGWVASLGDQRISALEMGGNTGFSAAVNAGIRASGGDLVLVANSDLFVSPGYAEEMIAFFDRRARAACASGKILRYDLAGDRPLSVIDTAGFAIGRDRRAVDRGEGVPDDGSFDDEAEVFASSGAALVVRRRALEDVAVAGEYFDESFFMYREDVDLSWRLRLRGWECWYVPTAVAYHGRTSRGLGTKPYRSAVREFLRNEKQKPQVARVHSMKNQWLLLLKNDDAPNFTRDLPRILVRESLVLGYNVVFAPRTLVSVPKFLHVAVASWRKRKTIKRRQVVAPAAIRPWFEAPPGRSSAR
jgi:GT2 family glycosyltransferase